MVEETKIPWGTIILLGALGLGAYFVYNYLKKSPVVQGATTIFEGATNVYNTGTSPGGLPAKVVDILEKYNIDLPEPIDLIQPTNLVPHILETIAVDRTGAINPMKAPILATLGVGILTNQFKKPTVAETKTKIPLVTISPTTKQVTILKPLEIVKTAQAIKNVNQIVRKDSIGVSGKPVPVVSVKGTSKISPTLTATVTKKTGMPTSVVLSKITR